MTGDGGEDPVESRRQRAAFFAGHAVACEILDELGNTAASQRCWNFAHDDCTSAEAFEHEPCLGQEPCIAREALGSERVEIHHFRHQQWLPGFAPPKKCFARAAGWREVTVQLRDMPTGVEVSGVVPEHNVSRKEMQRLVAAESERLWADLEAKVARHLQLPGA